MATRVVTVNDILDGHVALDLECFDRIYLNGWVPNLQVSGQVVNFLTHHLVIWGSRSRPRRSWRRSGFGSAATSPSSPRTTTSRCSASRRGNASWR